jgi:Glycosyltransferase family 87
VVTSSTALPASAAAAPWGLALANRKFRWILLAIAGFPIGIAYVWFGFLKPLLAVGPNDFVYSYIPGARMLAAGRDPYQCNSGDCGGLPHYPMINPPLAFWILQPVAAVDPRITSSLALVLANALLFAFIWLMLRALKVADRQVAIAVVLGAVSFAPTLTEVGNRNYQLVVLALSGVTLVAWMRGDRWWGGAALGVGLAIKLVQVPLLLFSLWGRRPGFTAAAVGAWAVLWLVAAPRYLPEYLTQVLPSQAHGTAAVINDAPLGTFNRLLNPASLYDSGVGGGIAVLVLAGLFALAIVGLSWWRLGRPQPGSDRRAVEVAVAIAASPLVLTVSYAGQFILLLLPMIVLFVFGLRWRSRSTVLAVAASWLLLGPVYLAFTNALAAGIGTQLILQVWANSAVLGAIVLWAASLHAIRMVDLRGVEPLTS